jgi:hypothetical protein
MPLFSLTYVSSARAELGTEELTRILESSVRHNTAQQVTGMLLYLNGSFIQVLEGEETAVDKTYARLRQDPRHIGCLLIERAPIKARSFAQWSMGFKRLKEAEVATHPSYTSFFAAGFDAATIGAKNGVALDILKKFGSGQGH